MFDWSYVHLGRVHLIWMAVLVTIGLVLLEMRSRDALSTFLSPVMQRRLSSHATFARSVTRLTLVFFAMVAGVIALMRPQAPGVTDTVTASRPSVDVMFVLDTSRSMLAEDTAPNRFARAKAEIEQMTARMPDARVGLVAFAGRAAPMCPLTPDHSFFRTALATVDTRSAGLGGTKIGEAIKKALEGFPEPPGAKLIVLITDGDDQDPYSEEAAKAARNAGVKIIAVGLGSEAGSQITLTDPVTKARTTLMHDGAPVISKLNGEQLRKVALITEGAYVPAGTSAVDLDSIMESHVTPIVKAASDAAVRVIAAERYPWPVLASLVFLLAAVWVGAGAGDAQRRAA